MRKSASVKHFVLLIRVMLWHQICHALATFDSIYINVIWLIKWFTDIVVFLSFSFSLFVLYASNYSYTVMGGQHRWAPACLAACHHIYFIIYYCIFLIWLIKLLLLLSVVYIHKLFVRNTTCTCSMSKESLKLFVWNMNFFIEMNYYISRPMLSL